MTPLFAVQRVTANLLSRLTSDEEEGRYLKTHKHKRKRKENSKMEG